LQSFKNLVSFGEYEVIDWQYERLLGLVS
jgi:hypothetical protein